MITGGVEFEPMKVVNILATYNERENIGPMLETLAKIARENPKYNFSTLVVDDNSPDGTSAVVKKQQKKDTSIKLLTGRKRGLGAALIKGYRYAMEEMGADVVIPNDADFQWPPEKIPHLLAKIEKGYDVAVASRHVPGGGVVGWNGFRRLNHLIANYFLAWHLAGVKEVRDHSGNFKAIRVKGVLEKIPLSKLRHAGFYFQLAILYELSKVGARFCEIPVVYQKRRAGESKIGLNRHYLRDIVEYVIGATRIRLDRNPQFFKFAVVGTIGFLVNAAGLEIFYRLGLPPGPAAAAGAEFAIMSNFTLNNLWTFSHSKITTFSKLILKFLQFNTTSAGAILIQGIVVGVGTYLFGEATRQIFLVIGIVFFIVPYNYTMYTVFIWKTKRIPALARVQKLVG